MSMVDTNYIGGIVKILETPKQKFFNNNIPVVEFRVQLPQTRNSKIVKLTFWGNLARDVVSYYKINDYVLIEGYLSFRDKKISNLTTQISKKIEITVLKIYPFLLSYNHSINKV
jgi:single-stranded DNA-binding protein